MADETSSPARAPWPFKVGIPQRFSLKYQRYQQLGGLVDVTEDAQAYAGEEPLHDIERLMFLSLTFDQVHKEGLGGDLAELGVYKGSTGAVLARYARRLNRRLYLMDTYQGFDQQDFSGVDAGQAPRFHDTSLARVRDRVGESNVRYVQGFFPQSADQLPDDARYCLVHIDTDLYAPIMSGLEYFYPRMVPGGFLIVHDYGSLLWAGAEKAVDRFFADKPECVIHIPDLCGSAVIRRLRPPGVGPTCIAKRQVLARDEWYRASSNELSSVLAEGWSFPESWGIWGVGASHQITLNTDAAPGQLFTVDLVLHAFVWDAIEGRHFDVFVNRQPASPVTFTISENQRTVSLENLKLTDSQGLVTIEFRPRKVVVPKDIKPSSAETRSLGIALHRLRVR
jgi:hypothetical protein